MAKRNHALVAVNASGFADETGRGGGNVATGIVIEMGKLLIQIWIEMPLQLLRINKVWSNDNRKLFYPTTVG